MNFDVRTGKFDVWLRTSVQTGLAEVPIALWEFSLGVRLIVKGFKTPPEAAGAA